MDLFYFVIVASLIFGTTRILSQTANNVKVDCHPEYGASEDACRARKCNWVSSAVPNEPWCIFDQKAENFAGYNLDQVDANSSTYFLATLSRRSTPSLFGDDDQRVKVRIQNIGQNELLVSFIPPRLQNQKGDYLSSMRKSILKHAEKFEEGPSYNVDIQSNPFGIRVTRKSTGKIIFDTTNISGFTHAQQFLSLTTRTATSNTYGFGEHVHHSLKHDMNWKRWGMFSRDEPSSGSKHNLYGVHPFHIGLEDDGNAHGILLLNANAQHVELSPAPSITYRTIGGRLDFLILLGPKPDQVIQQYVKLIGPPMMPPYWALGFHLCRFGYKSTNEVKQVVGRNQLAKIPQDAQWIDIDYMDKRMDFTYDRGNFSDLPKLVQLLKKRDLKTVLILDPAILSEDPTGKYKPLTEGLEQNVFIMDTGTKNPFQGKVWPGPTYFPDWTNPNTTSWWQKHVKDFHNDVDYDGIWIDMNEPANFLAGSPSGCTNNRWNNPPFVPLEDKNINTKTVCMDASEYGGRHYDVHSLYGHMEAIATHSALKNLFPNKRPFILSRSSFVGTGTYSFHWTGDNTSEWPHLKYSIIGMIEFGFFGIPFVGADICGFNLAAGGKSSDEELCTRWMQLGAFYPFSRNHNSDDKKDQDPAHWSPLSINSSRNALMTRYKFLPFLYTLIKNSNIDGSTVARPLFFEFPQDPITFAIDDQFLWGDALMIVPILTPRTFARSVYFPKARWFSLLNGTEVAVTGQTAVQIGQYEIGLYVRGGSILPYQEPAQNTVKSRQNPFGLLVALDENQNAHGRLYWDDGISPSVDIPYSYLHFNMTTKDSKGELCLIRLVDKFKDEPKLDTIQVYGLKITPTHIQYNDIDLADSQIEFDKTNKVLTLTYLAIDILNSNWPTNCIRWNVKIVHDKNVHTVTMI